MSRYVLCEINALSVGVAEALDPARHEVILLTTGAESEWRSRLPASVQVVTYSDPAAALLQYLPGCACLLALAEDDGLNLRMALLAQSAAPEVPVVLRCFDPSLADHLEEGANIRRAYSLSALSAPAFVSALLADELLTSLPLGAESVALIRFKVEEPLSGQALAHLEDEFDCRALQAPPGRLQTGQTLVLGGLLRNVLRAAARNHPLPPVRRNRIPRDARLAPTPSQTLIGHVARGLLCVLLIAVAVFWWTLGLKPVDAFYFVVTTATTTGYGDISLKDSPDWLKLFGCLVMVTGGGLVAILFSHLAAIVTADRLEERMHRQALHLENHIILAGLGRIGYRVERLLASVGIPCVVIDTQSSRFAGATRDRTILVKGDCRLPEDLQRAGVKRARALVACVDDDLGNLQTVLQARKLNPRLFTVARVTDPIFSRSFSAAFGIQGVVNPVQTAIEAFVGAARDQRAARGFDIEGTRYVAFCQPLHELSLERLAEWERQGVRILAAEADGVVGGARQSLPTDCIAAICGPEEAILRLFPQS